MEVGFGDGHFLGLAKLAGWDAVGIDPDPVLVRNALGRGLNVFSASLETLEFSPSSFDVIVMNNVLEHLHNPINALRICHSLLKVGGTIWIETPNIASLGHKYFGQNWRGLEPPRHIVIFNTNALRATLKSIGFDHIRHLAQTSICHGFFAASYRLTKGLDTDTNIKIPLRVKIVAAVAQIVEDLMKSRREFIAISATKR